jgi:hypothetical protein
MAPCSTPGEAQTFQISRLPPVDGPIAYRGSYRLLDGVTMSQAYQSVVAISLDVHGGLLIRQVHHWSADLFVAAICLRRLRAFFRGRFSGRALPGWLIWVVLLPLGMPAADWFNDIIEHRQFVQLGLIPSEFSGLTAAEHTEIYYQTDGQPLGRQRQGSTT